MTRHERTSSEWDWEDYWQGWTSKVRVKGHAAVTGQAEDSRVLFLSLYAWQRRWNGWCARAEKAVHATCCSTTVEMKSVYSCSKRLHGKGGCWIEEMWCCLNISLSWTLYWFDLICSEGHCRSWIPQRIFLFSLCWIKWWIWKVSMSFQNVHSGRNQIQIWNAFACEWSFYFLTFDLITLFSDCFLHIKHVRDNKIWYFERIQLSNKIN